MPDDISKGEVQAFVGLCIVLLAILRMIFAEKCYTEIIIMIFICIFLIGTMLIKKNASYNSKFRMLMVFGGVVMLPTVYFILYNDQKYVKYILGGLCLVGAGGIIYKPEGFINFLNSKKSTTEVADRIRTIRNSAVRSFRRKFNIQN